MKKSELEQWKVEEKQKANLYLTNDGFKFSNSKKVYFKKILFKNNSIDLLVKIPDNYPLTYPKVYINDKSWYLKYPHIEEFKELGSSICYLDDNSKIPFLDGHKIISHIMPIIYDLITSYEKNKFSELEFLKEFDSYWFDDFNYLDINSEITEATIISSLSFKGFNIIISNDKESSINKFTNLNLHNPKINNVIFLPLVRTISSQLPINYHQMMKIIKVNGYEEFVRNNINQGKTINKIIFSFYIEDKIHYAGCVFNLVKNKLPIFMPDYSIKKIRLKRIDRQRVFSRGGNHITEQIAMNDIKIAIVGCGSLGGSLAFKLAKSGIKNFTLIDKDFIDINNIGRHICSMKHLNKNKVDAVKQLILEHFPDCNIQAITKDAVDTFSELKKQNLIISAVGSEGSNFEFLLAQLINKPKIFSWFEGNIAGHIIYMNKISDKFGYISENIKITKNEYNSTLIKEDIGCNSFYAPYAFIDAENTVNHLARIITNFIIKKGRVEEEVWTIFGDTIENKEKIKEKYENIEPYSFIKRKIDKLDD